MCLDHWNKCTYQLKSLFHGLHSPQWSPFYSQLNTVSKNDKHFLWSLMVLFLNLEVASQFLTRLLKISYECGFTFFSNVKDENISWPLNSTSVSLKFLRSESCKCQCRKRRPADHSIAEEYAKCCWNLSSCCTQERLGPQLFLKIEK